MAPVRFLLDSADLERGGEEQTLKPGLSIRTELSGALSLERPSLISMVSLPKVLRRSAASVSRALPSPTLSIGHVGSELGPAPEGPACRGGPERMSKHTKPCWFL